MAQEEAKVAMWLENLRDERDGVALYRGLAELERDPIRAKEFAKLAVAEERHEAIWRKKLERAGIALPPERPSGRIRFLLWAAGRFGIPSVMPLVVMGE